MAIRMAATLLAASFLNLQCLPSPALAQNQTGYQLLSGQRTAALPRRGGALGMDVSPAQQVNEGGMTFELLRVNGVRRGWPGAQAGFNVGDQIIAVDGRVFPSVAAFAAYVGSVQPGRQITVDTMPAGGGPQQAQRIGVTVGAGRRAVPAQGGDQARSGGLSTGQKSRSGSARPPCSAAMSSAASPVQSPALAIPASRCSSPVSSSRSTNAGLPPAERRRDLHGF